MTPEERQLRTDLLVIQEVSGCLADLGRLAAQANPGNAGLRGGIAIGLQRAAARLMGKPFVPVVLIA